MGAAIKHPMPDGVKLSFVIFDIRALWSPVCRRMSVATDVVKGLIGPYAYCKHHFIPTATHIGYNIHEHLISAIGLWDHSYLVLSVSSVFLLLWSFITS